MDEILKELDEIFNMVSGVPVTHGAIDVMAIARAKLRHVHDRLKDMGRSIDEEDKKCE